MGIINHTRDYTSVSLKPMANIKKGKGYKCDIRERCAKDLAISYTFCDLKNLSNGSE